MSFVGPRLLSLHDPASKWLPFYVILPWSAFNLQESGTMIFSAFFVGSVQNSPLNLINSPRRFCIIVCLSLVSLFFYQVDCDKERAIIFIITNISQRRALMIFLWTSTFLRSFAWRIFTLAIHLRFNTDLWNVTPHRSFTSACDRKSVRRHVSRFWNKCVAAAPWYLQ